MKIHKVAPATASILACAFSSGVHAQDAEDTSRKVLSATVIKGDVLGQATEEEVRSHPGLRSVVNAEDLRKASVRGLDDALQRVPGVKIFDETGTGVLPQISVRGLYESRSGRVQVLSDGIPLSLAPYGQTSLSLFPQTLETVERIDIVRGGAAVQYGPNNVGGVINFISKPIPDEWKTTIGERITLAPAGRQLYDSYFSTGGSVNEQLGVFFEWNTKDGQYDREHSETDVDNFRFRGQWDIDENRSLSFGIQRYDADMELSGALSRDNYNKDRRDNTRDLDRFEGDTDRAWGTYNQYIGKLGTAEDVEFSFTAFGHHTYRNFLIGLPFTPDSDPNTFQDAPRDFRVWGLEPKVSFSFYGDAIDQTWLVGARFVRENTEFEVNRTNLDTGAYTVLRDWNFDTKGEAFFVSNTLSMLDGRLEVTPGIRHERVDMEYSDSVSGKETKTITDEWLPGLGIGFQFTDAWFLYANAQRSLRVPQITSIVRDGDVSAEIARNYEVGFRYTPQSNVRFDFGLYRIDFDDQIEYNRTTTRFENIGETRHQGIETEIFWTPAAMPQLDLHASYAYLDARQRGGVNDGKDVAFSSDHQFNIDARYNFRDNLTVAVDGLYVSEAYGDSAETRRENDIQSVGELPSYWLWNASVSKRTKMYDGELDMSLGVSNLFDREYYFRGTDTSPWGRQPAPGRTVTIATSYSF